MADNPASSVFAIEGCIACLNIHTTMITPTIGGSCDELQTLLSYSKSLAHTGVSRLSRRDLLLMIGRAMSVCAVTVSLTVLGGGMAAAERISPSAPGADSGAQFCPVRPTPWLPSTGSGAAAPLMEPKLQLQPCDHGVIWQQSWGGHITQ